jgi:transposase
MENINQRVCGLDVHEASIVACVIIAQEGKTRAKKEIRKLSAMRADIVQLRRWLEELGVTSVIMEGTGIYWRPVYEVLEVSSALDLWVVNARHVKKVPGRKTDVIDAEWLARLLQAGLVRKSFVPRRDIRELRDLTRFRRRLVQLQTTQKNQILKLIEQLGIKLSAVVADPFGKSGMAMLEAIAEGKSSTEEIAQLAKSALRQKLPQLRLALDCLVAPHHRAMLKDQLDELARLTTRIQEYEATIAKQAEPYTENIKALCTIHGVRSIAAHEIFAEVGPDLASFPNAASFSAWVGTAPGVNESAGKNRSGRRRKGNPYLTSILMECALAATRKKGSYLKEKFRRLRLRRPALVALFAIANKLAHAVHRVITSGNAYVDLGAAYLDRRNPMKVAKTLIKRLATLELDREDLVAMLAAIPRAPTEPPPPPPPELPAT